MQFFVLRYTRSVYSLGIMNHANKLLSITLFFSLSLYILFHSASFSVQLVFG